MTECSFFEDSLPEWTGESNAQNQIGATATFVGTIRADEINHKKVIGIEFSTHVEIAKATSIELLEKYKKQYKLNSACIYHRTGFVKAGDLCFRVVVNAGHRKEAFAALPQIVDDFKANVPVFGKEILEDNTHEWKQNK